MFLDVFAEEADIGEICNLGKGLGCGIIHTVLKLNNPRPKLCLGRGCVIEVLLHSISSREAFFVVVLLFQLIHHSHGVILDGDEALAFLVEEHVVLAQTVLACAHARGHVAEVASR